MLNPFTVGEKVLTSALPKAIPALSAISLILGIAVNLVTLVVGLQAIENGNVEDADSESN